MLAANRERVLTGLSAEALVLDVGGGASPFARADWVLDLMPYAERGLYGRPDPAHERFSERTWVVRDICDREPWPFAEGHFDYVVCSHTLEDIRDPVWVCSELQRVARAGYIEVPSRLEEQSFGFQGPWVGWGHHRWLIDIGDQEIVFTFKHHIVHGRRSDHFPAGFRERLTPAERTQWLFWSGCFGYREQLLFTAEEADAYVAGYVVEHQARVRVPAAPRSVRARLRRLGSRPPC